MATTVLFLIFALLHAVCAERGYNLPPPPPPSNSYGAPNLRTLDVLEEDPLEALAANIPGGGVPGQDYPILASVVDTGFSCLAQEYVGYFADTADESGCQIFHICQFDGRQDSFLCPNGTVFNQQYFVCDWWFNVDCAASEQFRSLNAEIGKVMEDSAASSRIEAVEPNQLYGAPTSSQFYSSPNRF